MPRGAKLGERRGGRQKATPNKRTQAVADTLAELGCNPIEGMQRSRWMKVSRCNCGRRCIESWLNNIPAKRKALEHKGEMEVCGLPQFIIDIGQPPFE
jgi:hypothetical protein